MFATMFPSEYVMRIKITHLDIELPICIDNGVKYVPTIYLIYIIAQC